MRSVPSGGVIPAFLMYVGSCRPVLDRALNEGIDMTWVIREAARYAALAVLGQGFQEGDQVPNLVKRRHDEASGVCTPGERS